MELTLEQTRNFFYDVLWTGIVSIVAGLLYWVGFFTTPPNELLTFSGIGLVSIGLFGCKLFNIKVKE